jgi:hypothetical protein
MRRLVLLLPLGFLLACSDSTAPPTSLDTIDELQLNASGGGGQVKVEVCHRTAEGSYNLITIGEPAFDSHVAHGDASPGEPVPANGTFRFDGTCALVPATPDQSNPGPPADYAYSSCGGQPQSLYQSFRPLASELRTVRLYLRIFSSQVLTVNIRAGAFDNPVFASASATGSYGLGDVDFEFGPPVGLTPGATYFIEYVGAPTDATWGWTPDLYPDGAYYGCTGVETTDRDFVFATF